MYQLINEKLAVKCGVHAALIAMTIWTHLSFSDGEPHSMHQGRCWMRSSYRMFTISHPFLTRSTVQTAIRKLMRLGILVRGNFNESQFDHTPWYSYTEYGRVLMLACESEDEE